MKKIIYILVTMFAVTIGINEAEAKDCSKYACSECTYKQGSYVYSYTVYDTGDGNIQLDFNGNNDSKQIGNFKYYFNNHITAQNFYNKTLKRLACLENIYATTDGGQQGATTNLYNTKCSDCSAVSLTTNNSNNIEIGSPAKSCDYDVLVAGTTNTKLKITITSDGKKVDVITPNGYTAKVGDGITPFTNKDACPNLRINCGNGICGINLPTDDESGIIGGDTPTEDDIDKPIDNSNPDASTNGLTIALLKKIYRIIKILVPVLIVLLSIVDFLKVVLLSDEKDYNNAWNKFIKRIVVGIVFFVLPVLITFILKYSGIDIEQSFLEIFI